MESAKTFMRYRNSKFMKYIKYRLSQAIANTLVSCGWYWLSGTLCLTSVWVSVKEIWNLVKQMWISIIFCEWKKCGIKTERKRLLCLPIVIGWYFRSFIGTWSALWDQQSTCVQGTDHKVACEAIKPDTGVGSKDFPKELECYKE